MTAHNAERLFAEMVSKGLIDRDEQSRLETFAISRISQHELPLYMRALIGLGAIIAAFCFTGFLAAAGLIDVKQAGGLIIWGVLFIAGAILLWVASKGQDHTVAHSFFLQTSFCLMGAGKALFALGIATLFEPESEWGFTLGALLVTAATYHVYRLSIDRFLSVLAILVTLFSNLLSLRSAGEFQAIWLNAFFIAQLVAAALLMTHGRISRDYIPIAYALIASICIIVLYFATQSMIGYWASRYEFSPVIMDISLTVALIALIGWASGGFERLKSEALVVACLGAIGLGVVSAPGVLLSIGLMIFGYARHDRLLLVGGGLLLPVFLTFYYYNLDLTLMEKSGVLIGSGLLLLAGRAYMHYRGLDREA
jgi:hypothetical protein